jgi:hypothetical protein
MPTKVALYSWKARWVVAREILVLIYVCIWRLLESWIGHSNFGIMTKSVELRTR